MKQKNDKRIRLLLLGAASVSLLSGCVRIAPDLATADRALSAPASENGSNNISEPETELSESISEVPEAATEGLSASLDFSDYERSEDQTEQTTEATAQSPENETSVPAPLLPESASEDTPPAKTAVLYGPQIIPGYSLLQKITLPDPQKRLSMLKADLKELMADYDGSWSVCVIDLQTGASMTINDTALPSASLMKLFILGAVYEKIGLGELPRTSELVDKMSSMIRNSSNEAANALLYILGGSSYEKGIDVVNEYIHANGYSDATIACNPFQNEQITVHPGMRNQTSAKDCADIFARIYHRTFSSRKNCNETEEWLLSQATRYKIPSVIPEGVQVGNKTGETDDVENDTAIVYSAGGDYIVSVLSTGWSDKNGAQNRIKNISSAVYTYFNDEDYLSRHVIIPM